MVDKIIFTVTPIFSIPPRGAAAVETWMYQVAQRTTIPNRIVCIKNEGYSDYTQVNDNCSIHRIGFSRVYKRIFQKWTRLDPLPYSQRILNIAKDFPITDKSVIVVHNSMKLYRQIRERAPQTKIVLHMHNAFEPKGLNPDIKMIVPSQFLKNYYQAYLPDADIVIVDNGIDLDAYQSDCSSQLRSELNLTTRDKVIFYAGRIVPDKGVLLLLKAFEKLVEEQSDLKLVVVGDHMEVSKSDKGAYQQEVRDVAARMQDKCLMLGSIPPEKMHLYYPLADLVVIPSQFKEPFCMVAIEAMGAGKPVLVSTRGGMVEFVKSEETGYHLREPMTVDSIAQDIKDVLAREDLHRTAEQGQNQIFERYSWSSVTQSFEAVIHNWFD
ncbi:lipopolysaccharide N-acetylglucosaminyltransferase [Leclercia pneumoniae]|uniref:lipopolysaccharide N-acetylglucosaminyltransferase n=1 Tax=Leclercia TaxID=83654 RepID=UPI001BACE356|nr:lipopolysaccharide N-acetylglucosaminyltransferase [Leclercia pneumoniae]MBS0853209.1 lipopolysaccharide N-acetylglucosaminyltransferase [Enterobacter sp. JGM127]MCE6965827.1 lipopolysaccharide N-acetylglucosaminyltransferase [Enterobacter sp. MW07]MCV2511128.1 lipopolysaccharide N-acetylglucosaminyltransferase [Leclercia pneumoniae]WNN81343.1 lipopolysaccharide N-acetylglucosaminyltransferase [Leclercia pneumoniae]